MGTPPMPPFFQPRGDLHHPALGISPLFAAPHPQQGGGGGLAVHGGGMGMEDHAGKAPVPHPRTSGGLRFDAVQSFYGAAGGLDAGLPLGAIVPPLRGKGVGENAALRAQVGVHPPVGIYFGGGVYDSGQEALYEGASEGLTITRPIKPLGRAAPATSNTMAPTGAPKGTGSQRSGKCADRPGRHAPHRTRAGF